MAREDDENHPLSSANCKWKHRQLQYWREGKLRPDEMDLPKTPGWDKKKYVTG